MTWVLNRTFIVLSSTSRPSVLSSRLVCLKSVSAPRPLSNEISSRGLTTIITKPLLLSFRSLMDTPTCWRISPLSASFS